MLFQGEEWAASTPFQFFTDHNKELGEAVKKGRRAEFAEHGWNSEDVPDPQDPETFKRSKLDWKELAEGRHKESLEWYKKLILLRRRVKEFSRQENVGAVEATFDEEKRWFVLKRGDLNGKVAVVVNFAKEKQLIPIAERGEKDGHDINEGIQEVLLASWQPDWADGGKDILVEGEGVAIVRLRV